MGDATQDVIDEADRAGTADRALYAEAKRVEAKNPERARALREDAKYQWGVYCKTGSYPG